MKKFFLFFIFFPSFIFAITIDTRVYGNRIWLSSPYLILGNKVRIYAEFQNKNNFDTVQDIVFYDNDVKIGEKKIEIAANSKVISWIDYEVKKEGDHKFLAENKKVIKDDLEKKEEVKVKPEANLLVIKTDKDTDGDGIPNSKDDDDDNDGYKDEGEIKAGSNPESKISTPKTEKVVKKVDNLLDVLNKKREEVQKSIQKKIIENQAEKKQTEKREEKIKNILADYKEYRKKIEKIDKKNIDEFQKKELAKIQKESKSDFDKKNKENILKLVVLQKKKNDKRDLSSSIKKEFQLLNLVKNEKELKKVVEEEKGKIKKDENYEVNSWMIKSLEDDKKKEFDGGWVMKFWNFLSWIFSSLFLTIIFIILVIYIFWKIVRKIIG